MKDRLPNGERKFVRRRMSAVGRQTDRLTFRADEKTALAAVGKECFPAGIPPEFDLLIRRYWGIRKEFYERGNEEVFKGQRQKFNKDLDSIDDVRLEAALRIISTNFAQHPGR